MSEITETPAAASDSSARVASAKTNALIGYLIMASGILLGFTWIVGAIWAMVKKNDASGTIFEDHYSNMITTFWWSFGLSILGFILAIVVIGWLLLLGVWIWSVYRIVKGIARLTSDQPYKAVKP